MSAAWLARASLAVVALGVAGLALGMWRMQPPRCAAHVQIQAEMNKQLTKLLEADLANSATPDEAREIERLRRRLSTLGEIRERPGEDAVVVPQRVMDELLAKARHYERVVDDADPLRVKAMESEIRALLRQLGERDAQLERLLPSRPLRGEPPPRATPARVAEWVAQSEPDSPLGHSGFFSARNWAVLRGVLVMVATGRPNHETRAKLQMRTWMTLMPAPQHTLVFVTEENSAHLAPLPVLVFPMSSDEVKEEKPYRSAQRRFLRALVLMAKHEFAGQSPPTWVLMLDDDSLLDPVNLAKLLPKLDPARPRIYAQVCAEQAGIPFPCGGGGILMSLQTLRRSRRALESCYLPWGGDMGQYDVAISHCFLAAGVAVEARGEFSSHRPSHYTEEFGKGRHLKAQFANPVTFHYVVKEMEGMYRQILDMEPLWPAKNVTAAALTRVRDTQEPVAAPE